MKAFAFHGDGARPSDLQSDMGDPGWVDEYVDYRSNGWLDRIRAQESVVLIGYSRGGDVIASLSLQLRNILGVVLYESPLFSVAVPGGRFPALVIWNDNSPRASSKAAEEALAGWRAGGRSVDVMVGRGRHTKPVWRPRTLFLGHGWDTAINHRVEKWIRSLT